MAGRGGVEQSQQAEHPAAVAPPASPGSPAEGDDPDPDDTARARALAASGRDIGAGTGAGGGLLRARGGPDQLAAALILLGDPSEREVHLTSQPESAAAARRLALSVVRKWGLPHLADVVELLVSELVGNAVRHTGARTVGLRMDRRRGRVRVEVRDPSRALPCRLPVRPTDTSGRGLFLVDKLSDRWGADLQSRGKTTWFELRVTDRL